MDNDEQRCLSLTPHLSSIKLNFFLAGENAIAYEQITEEIMHTHTLIINCTPLGMVGHGVDQCPAIPYELLSEKHLLYDIVYNPENTLFLQKGAAQGAATKSGYEMWHLQALASWEIWNK